MSPGKDQEWFSDGLTEELLNSLSSLEDLRLISRTTSFSFKDKGLSAKRIADSLGVAHVLEGSVRKNDDQLRVTVQLIKALDDTHLWSHIYEYTIDSVFRIQGDISKNVANTLNLLLDADTRNHMNNVGTTSVEAYQEYLKGKAKYREAHVSGNIEMLNEANKFYENAIRIYPNFANAYYDHADIYSHSLLSVEGVKSLGNLSEKEQYDRLMNDLNKALELSQIPNNKIGYNFTRDFFSNDWSRLPSYIGVKENWNSGWEVFLTFIDPEFVTRRYLKSIQIDQFADMDRYWAATGFAYKGDLDSALLLYESEYTKSNISLWVKSALLFRKGDYSNALKTISNAKDIDDNIDGYILFLRLLSGEQSMSRAEIDHALSLQPLFDPYGYSTILAYNALGEYQKADSIASIIDKRVLGHCSLAYNLLQFGLHFHLSATPNFAARLRELGIDTDAFEKKQYKKLPLITPAK
jgi:TolB-like protein